MKKILLISSLTFLAAAANAQDFTTQGDATAIPNDSTRRQTITYRHRGDRVYLTDFLSFGNTAPRTLEFVRAETGDFAFRYRTGDIVEIG